MPNCLRDSNMEQDTAFVTSIPGARRNRCSKSWKNRFRVLGDYDLCISASYGGLTTEQSEKELRLFAEEVARIEVLADLPFA